jgi:hypothetical protein
VITGDFTGDGFADAFVFYSSTVTDSSNPNHVRIKFGARVGTAVDVNTVDSGLRFGGEQPYGNDSVSNPNGLYPLVLSETAVTGDFNGDGRDKIAMLMSDRKTIQFFSVDPATLSIKPLTSIVLPTALNTAAGLCAGHFRNSISQGKRRMTQLLGGAGNGNLQGLNEYVTLLKAQGSVVPERAVNKLLGEVDAILTCQGR